jgi:demethylmenaquinone methyltransferase/2-methoxy-6-polyprenyl-1,4-benzoquinol methylase
MFAGISKRYDFLNRLLSLNRDRYWRRVAVSKLEVGRGCCFLDMCAGTGDVAIEIARWEDFSGSVVAGDFCTEMLQLGVDKCEKLKVSSIRFVNADAENLPFKEDSFDGAVIAFGIRNVADRERALCELTRTLRAGGRIAILEFSIPSNRIFKALYYCYFKKILPLIGSIISRHGSAYSYLPDSVLAFPSREEFASLMRRAGVEDVEFSELTLGIVTLYTGKKKG